MLKTVDRQPTLTERAEQQLEALVLERSQQPGEKLPSENEIGRMLGVSRTVVREAVRKLVAKGLVEARTGSGIYTRALGSAMVEQPLDLLMRGLRLTAAQLIEVREMLEVRGAELAAERADEADIKALEANVEALRGKELSRSAFVEADLGFNRALAVATHNPLFQILTESVNAVLRGFIEGSIAAADLKKEQEVTLGTHGRILRAVKARDVVGARKAAEDELAKARTTLKTSGTRRTKRRE